MNACGVSKSLMRRMYASRRCIGRCSSSAAFSLSAPWIQRRLTGRSSGDGLTPRYPDLVPAPGPAPGSADARATTATEAPASSGIV